MLRRLMAVERNGRLWVAEVLAALGGILYTFQSWRFAHNQFSVLDEGLYLFKGYLFAIGRYQPFQDYGPWTNHMPLSFLIPGYLQKWIEPGLRTGRYAAVALGVLMLLGLWILAYRLGGRWWAAGIVWAVAVNPAVIKMFSVMASQGLVACMLVWTLVLVLGEERSWGELLVGSVLAALIPLTRMNLAPVLPLVAAYIFWEHGRWKGVVATLVGASVFTAVFSLYLPNILSLWVKWIPEGLVPFAEAWRLRGIGSPSWRPPIDTLNRLVSFFEGFRYHFLAVVGFLVALLLWPPKASWQPKSKYKVAVFLASLFAILWGLHAWVALQNTYCVFCYSVYLSFFSSLGLLLIVVSSPFWLRKLPAWRESLAVLLIVGISAAIGFSSTPYIRGEIVSDDFIRRLVQVEIPRIRDFRIAPEGVPLWGILTNKFGWEYTQIVVGTKRWLSSLLSTGLGLLVGSGAILGARWMRAVFARRSLAPQAAFSTLSLALMLFLALGFVLSPTRALGGGRGDYDCGSGVIESYEEAGQYLAEAIPAGSRLYWNGESAVVLLTYMEGVEIFPPQLNNGYSYRLGGEPDVLYRRGYWNETLARQWAAESDLILLTERGYNGWIVDYLSAEEYRELQPVALGDGCRKSLEIHLFWKEK